jgi:hypothetical protein
LAQGFLTCFRRRFGFVTPAVPALAIQWAETMSAYLIFRALAHVDPTLHAVVEQISDRLRQTEADAEDAGKKRSLS